MNDFRLAKKGGSGRKIEPYVDGVKHANVTPRKQAPSGTAAKQSTDSLRRSGHDQATNSAQDVKAKSPTAAYCGTDRRGSSEEYGCTQLQNLRDGARNSRYYGELGHAGDEPVGNCDTAFAGTKSPQTVQSQNRLSDSAPVTSSYCREFSAPSSSHGGYGEQRQLTVEEQEEAEYQAILAEKRQIQQQSASSVFQCVQMAKQANKDGQKALARLGAQGEQLDNTERNLNHATIQNRIAGEKTKELERLNQSMFAFRVKNPFISKERQERADQEILNRGRAERVHGEFATSKSCIEPPFEETKASQLYRLHQQKDYGKYNLEEEEGANEIEDQIDNGLNELEREVAGMNRVGRAIGRKVCAQNRQITRMTGQVRFGLYGLSPSYTNHY